MLMWLQLRDVYNAPTASMKSLHALVEAIPSRRAQVRMLVLFLRLRLAGARGRVLACSAPLATLTRWYRCLVLASPACSGACPASTKLVAPCSADADRVCVADAHAECVLNAKPLTVLALEAITEDNCNNCAQYLPHINTALKEGHMQCALRTSAFIAQARHATDGFKYLKSASSNGAGAIHLQPSNFPLACEQVPELKTAFISAFGTCQISTAQQGAAANIVAQPQYAFRVAVWWFVRGSAQLLGSPCGDLRFDSDYGLGRWQMCLCALGGARALCRVSVCLCVCVSCVM